MALDAAAALPLKWEVSFLLNQADVASPRGLFLALAFMKLICTMLLASLFATCECEAADQQAKILSFHLGDISANPPYVSIEKMNRVTWARMQDGSLKADGYATVTGGENPKKKISYWLSGDKRNLKICYHLTPYTHDELYPPDHPDWAPAAAAWIVPVEIRISGLKFAPKKALISDRCK